MNTTKKHTRRILTTLAIAIVLASPLSAVVLPLLGQKSHAQGAPGQSQPSGLNMFEYRTYNILDNDTPSVFQTCKPVFQTKVLTQNDIKWTNMSIGGTELEFAEKEYLESFLGQSVPIIDWVFVNQSDMPQSRIVNGSYTSGGANICDSIPPTLPVATNKWKGPHYQHIHGTTVEVLSFTRTSGGSNTSGILDFVCLWVNDNQCPDSGRRQAEITVEGSPSGTGSGSLVRLDFDARWVDAATIVLNRSFGSGGGSGVTQETYRMTSWRAHGVNEQGHEKHEWSLYFLAEAEGARASQTWSSGRGCENPIQNADSEMHPSGDCRNTIGENFNCVPFIAVHQRININRANGSLNIEGDPGTSFSNRINQLGGAGAIRYDYREDCSYMGNSGPTERQLATNSRANAKIWFYQSGDKESITSIFPSGAGDGNESPFTGTYRKVAEESQPGTPTVIIYEGGLNGCSGRARVTHNPGASGNRLPTEWSFFPSNCQGAQTIGTVDVFTLTGQPGADNFDRAGTALPPAVGIPESDDDERLRSCSGNPLTWIICPFIWGSVQAIEWLDGQINNMLTVNAFDQEKGVGEEAFEAYHHTWGVFRSLALAFIVVAALVVIIAHAAGLELINAYTFRKVLPRLLIATVAIVLSWQIALALIDISNGLGQAVRSIIYAPFGNLDATIGAGTQFVLALLFAGGLILSGPLALLSFAATGFIAVMVAFALLAFREIAIIALTLVMPIAIAASILPGTQKLWEMWRKSFFMLLAVFVIIMVFVAAGRVFASTAATAGANDESGFWGAFMQVIAIVAYFAPYFLIPYAFKLAGGALAMAGGLAAAAYKGANSRVQKFRKETGSEWRENTARGNTWLGRIGGGRAGNVFDRFRNTKEGSFVPTRRGQARYLAARQARRLSMANKALQEDGGRAAGNDDALSLALRENMTRGQFLAEYEKMGYSADQARRALGELEVGFGAVMGSNDMAVAAFMAKANSGTAYAPGDFEQMFEDANSLMSRGLITAEDAVGIFKRNKARADISGISFNTFRNALSKSLPVYQQASRQPGFMHGKHMAGLVPAITTDGRLGARELRRDILGNALPGALLSQRPEALEAVAPEILTQIQEGMQVAETGYDYQLQEQLANLAGLYDVMAQVNPAMRRILADNVLGQTLPNAGQLGFAKQTKDPATGEVKTVNMTIQEMLETYRNDPEAYRWHSMRRDYVQRLNGQIDEERRRTAMGPGATPGSIPTPGGPGT